MCKASPYPWKYLQLFLSKQSSINVVQLSDSEQDMSVQCVSGRPSAQPVPRSLGITLLTLLTPAAPPLPIQGIHDLLSSLHFLLEVHVLGEEVHVLGEVSDPQFCLSWDLEKPSHGLAVPGQGPRALCAGDLDVRTHLWQPLGRVSFCCSVLTVGT